MCEVDPALLNQIKCEIGNLNQRAADLGKDRNAIIASIVHLAAIVEAIENGD